MSLWSSLLQGDAYLHWCVLVSKLLTVGSEADKAGSGFQGCRARGHQLPTAVRAIIWEYGDISEPSSIHTHVDSTWEQTSPFWKENGAYIPCGLVCLLACLLNVSLPEVELLSHDSGTKSPRLQAGWFFSLGEIRTLWQCSISSFIPLCSTARAEGQLQISQPS